MRKDLERMWIRIFSTSAPVEWTCFLAFTIAIGGMIIAPEPKSPLETIALRLFCVLFGVLWHFMFLAILVNYLPENHPAQDDQSDSEGNPVPGNSQIAAEKAKGNAED